LKFRVIIEIFAYTQLDLSLYNPYLIVKMPEAVCASVVIFETQAGLRQIKHLYISYAVYRVLRGRKAIEAVEIRNVHMKYTVETSYMNIDLYIYI
jgi:hypothetical protein